MKAKGLHAQISMRAKAGPAVQGHATPSTAPTGQGPGQKLPAPDMLHRVRKRADQVRRNIEGASANRERKGGGQAAAGPTVQSCGEGEEAQEVHDQEQMLAIPIVACPSEAGLTRFARGCEWTRKMTEKQIPKPARQLRRGREIARAREIRDTGDPVQAWEVPSRLYQQQPLAPQIGRAHV